mgnify:CR=1 FL=1
MEEIVLRKMSKDEFENYFQNKIERYSNVLSENIHEQGDEPSTKALKQLKGLLHLIITFLIYKEEKM